MEAKAALEMMERAAFFPAQIATPPAREGMVNLKLQNLSIADLYKTEDPRRTAKLVEREKGIHFIIAYMEEDLKRWLAKRVTLKQVGFLSKKRPPLSHS